MKNKKANIPITLLVIGIFVICALAIVTFISSDIKTSGSFEGLEAMKNINSKINKYSFYSGEGVNVEGLFDVRFNDFDEEVLYVEAYGKKGFFNLGEDYLIFSVEYVLD